MWPSFAAPSAISKSPGPMTWRWRASFFRKSRRRREVSNRARFRSASAGARIASDSRRRGDSPRQEFHRAFRRRCALPRGRRCLAGRCGIGQHWRTLSRYRSKVQGNGEPEFSSPKRPSLLEQNGFRIENIDSNILAERPKLLPHFPAMREKLAAASGIPVEKISIKAKTMEGLGVIGTEEAIAAEAIALVSFE